MSTSAQQQPVAMQIKSETGWAHRHTMASHVVSRCPIGSRQVNQMARKGGHIVPPWHRHEMLRAVCIRHPRMISPPQGGGSMEAKGGITCGSRSVTFSSLQPVDAEVVEWVLLSACLIPWAGEGQKSHPSLVRSEV